jgi:hypothetical protein
VSFSGCCCRIYVANESGVGREFSNFEQVFHIRVINQRVFVVWLCAAFFFVGTVSRQTLSWDRMSKLAMGNLLSNRQFSGRTVFVIMLFLSPWCRSCCESQDWGYQISELNRDGQTFLTIVIFQEKVKKIWHFLRIFLRFWQDSLKTSSQIITVWNPFKKRIIIRKMYYSFENKINCCKTPFQKMAHTEVMRFTVVETAFEHDCNDVNYF